MRRALLAWTLCLPALALADERPFAFAEREGTIRTLRRSGDPALALDLVLVADRYEDSRSERKRLGNDAEELLTLFDEVEPFRTYRDLFNVYLVWLPGDASLFDVALPHPEPRNLITFDRHALQRLLAATGLSWDAVHVLVDERRFGGSARRGEAVSISTRNKGDLNRERQFGLVRVLAHELGHAWGGLVEERAGEGEDPERQDELYAGQLPNAFLLGEGDARDDWAARLPWVRWLEATPAVTRAARRESFPFQPRFDPDRAPVGLFEGAGSLATGGLRAQEHCLMRSDAGQFCVVCREAMVLALHRLAQPSALTAIPVGDEVQLALTSLLPAGQVQVRWEAEGGSPALAEALAEATAAGAPSVRVAAADAGAVRCVVQDTTPWVRRVTVSATLRAPAAATPSPAASAPQGGATAALGGAFGAGD